MTDLRNADTDLLVAEPIDDVAVGTVNTGTVAADLRTEPVVIESADPLTEPDPLLTSGVNYAAALTGGTALASELGTDTLATENDAPPRLTNYQSRFSGTKVSFARIVRSEWLKLWSLRSSWWVVALTIVLMAGFALLFAFVIDSAITNGDGPFRPDGPMGGAEPADIFNGIMFVTLGYNFAQLTIGILGVLTITNEYTSGMIRATFSAAPHRLVVLGAKLLVLMTTTLLITAFGLLLSLAVTYPLLHRHGLTVDFSEALNWRSLLGVLLYLLAIAILSLGIGTLIRHTAGAIAAVVALLNVVPMIFGIILFTADVEWARTIYKYLPTEAGSQIISGEAGMDGFGGPMMADAASALDPWPGMAVLAGYALIALIAAMIMLRRRDA